MQRPLLDFICSGAVGELTLGLRRSDVISKLGAPQSWLGKPPCIGPIVSKLAEATIWFYYGDVVGIEFDRLDVSVRINVMPEKMCGQAPFEDWSIGLGATMADFRNYLVQNRIPFYEELNLGETHYIHADKGCVAQCSKYKRGRMLPPDERPLTMIATVTNDELLPNFVRKRYRRGP